MLMAIGGILCIFVLLQIFTLILFKKLINQLRVLQQLAEQGKMSLITISPMADGFGPAPGSEKIN